jgi:amino acid transporter
VSFPSQGGTVEFLNQAFGTGLASGSLNVLLWLSYIIMLALYAYAFGGYAASLAGLEHSTLARHGFISAVLLVLTGLNSAGAAVTGRTELWIVAAKVAILLLFVGAGTLAVDPQRLGLENWAAPLAVAGGGMIIFLAYEGFELIANTAQDLAEPQRTLPRAYYSAVLFVIALYVAVAAVVVGALPIAQIVDARDYALAAAARPSLGGFGFTLVSIAALLSTASAINATLYGAARVSYVVAKEGELPTTLEKKVWHHPREGLLITAAAALAAANLLDLSSIATSGSAGFLLVFAAVNLACLRLAGKTGSRPWIPLLGLAACTAALGTLLVQTAQQRPAQLWVPALMLLASVLIESGYRRFSPARQRPRA